MESTQLRQFLEKVLEDVPTDWLRLTTHRLDIYNENQAKKQFLDQFELLYQKGTTDTQELSQLATAYDYIRLGHPLSCVLEWSMASMMQLRSDQVISFSSCTMPLLAILRKNRLLNRPTRILHTEPLPTMLDIETLTTIYDFQFDIQAVDNYIDIKASQSTTILIRNQKHVSVLDHSPEIDMLIDIYADIGSVISVFDDDHRSYISDIQHVRRRETIAMTPANCLKALHAILYNTNIEGHKNSVHEDRAIVEQTIQKITATDKHVILGSSGLSIQYAIMMGLVHHALSLSKDKKIKIIVPPNCYGGTNDQARRLAAMVSLAEVVDLPVDGGHDMVDSLEKVLVQIAEEDAVPFIIAEIPTNPRVEVPDLYKLHQVLKKERKTALGRDAISPVFILDQTFCPNVSFLENGGYFSDVATIAYISGSKFPSGGLCTAGYAVANDHAAYLMPHIEKHLHICDNGATAEQIAILAQQLPSMPRRIHDAYLNTAAFVDHISKVLPEAKINFVDAALADNGFTPSVFSIDLPTKGSDKEERERIKRQRNKRLIDMMISRIPNESKHCVSYGQLSGCYWTIPATSTQGTTKEKDKDYIVRVSISPDIDLDLHKKVFSEFVKTLDHE